MDINSEIEVLKTKLENVDRKVDDIAENMDKHFNEIREDLKCHIRREEFAPVKAIAYGFVGIVLTTVIGALLTLIVR